jgi:hypothetical protein
MVSFIYGSFSSQAKGMRNSVCPALGGNSSTLSKLRHAREDKSHPDDSVENTIDSTKLEQPLTYPARRGNLDQFS